MVDKEGRRIWLPLLTWVLLLATAAALVVGAPAPAAVPALAGSPMDATPADSRQGTAAVESSSFWHLVLRSGLPPLNVEPAPEAAGEPLLHEVAAAIPFALLRLAVPGLAVADEQAPYLGDTSVAPDQGSLGAESPASIFGSGSPQDFGAGLSCAGSQGNCTDAGATEPAPIVGPATDPEITACGHNPFILVYHTHSEESFLPVLGPFVAPEDAFTPDRSKDMVAVGDAFVRNLCAAGLSVIHLRTRFDAAGRLGAYERSLVGVQAVLQRWPTLHVLLDLHRDDAPRAATTALIGGQPTARVLIVVGNDQTLPEPRWRANAAWALQVARAMDASYPGLARPYGGNPYYSDGGRFDQQLSTAALLFEIGGEQNTPEEEVRGAQLLARVIGRLVATGRYPY